MVYLSLGTNLGDRDANLTMAAELLQLRLGVQLITSIRLETKSIGFDGADFINQIAVFDGPEGLTPESLLDICQEIEAEMGRERHAPLFDEKGCRIYEDRVIDIDILFFDDLTIETERLSIPHPQVKKRIFVTELLQNLQKQYPKLGQIINY